jgi:hypothetical protein
MQLIMENFWSQILPNWIMAVAAAWGVFEIIRGYFKLKQQQIENEQKVKFLEEQLNEFRRQTTQFEFQTSIMSESNLIIEKGIDNLTKILGHGQEAEEKRLEIEIQRRSLDIRPFFNILFGHSNPKEFSIKLINRGGTATDFRIIDTSNDLIKINNLRSDRIIEKGQELEISGKSNDAGTGYNSNLATGQFLLGYSDIDNNKYQQNIIKNYSGYQVGLPTRIEK